MQTDAILSSCGNYRYSLARKRDLQKDDLIWVLLNPSTADSTQDDPTIRKIIQFSKNFGYWWCLVYNLFALRSTDPKVLITHSDPIWPDNDNHIQTIPTEKKIVFARWNHGILQWRSTKVIDLLKDHNTRYLEKNKSQQPKHPLYVWYNIWLKKW